MLKQIFAPLFALKGNPRYAVFTEPLWGIPFNLYIPFLTLYMASFGLEDTDIGILLSVGLAVQMVAGIFSGVLTDKFGRRKTNIVWDIVAWTIPCLVWAFAQDFRWFLVAAIFNGLWPIGSNAWECLLVEDAEPNEIVNLFNWVYIAGLLAVFFAPISGFLIAMYSLEAVMRILLIFAAVSMTTKFICHFTFAKETKQGEVRMRETKNVPIIHLLAQYKGVIKQIFTTPATVRVLVLITILHIQQLIASTFFSLYVVEDLGLRDEHMVVFSVVRGAIMLLFFLVFQRILNRYPIYAVMLGGLMLYISGYILLIFAPAGLIFPLIIFTAIDACAAALFLPRRDSLVILNVDAGERARIRAMMMVIMLGAASPFGFISGILSGIDRRIPFAACLGLFLLMGIIVLKERRQNNETSQRATA